MIIFDLRGETQQLSALYAYGGIAVALVAAVALSPKSIRDRLNAAFADAVWPLVLVLVVYMAIMIWNENGKRKQAEALVEQCWNGGCNVVEGRVHDVEPVRQISSGGRYSAPTYRGTFKVGDEVFFHYPSDNSAYSPANLLRDGDRARVHSQDDIIVLVEVID